MSDPPTHVARLSKHEFPSTIIGHLAAGMAGVVVVVPGEENRW